MRGDLFHGLGCMQRILELNIVGIVEQLLRSRVYCEKVPRYVGSIFSVLYLFLHTRLRLEFEFLGYYRLPNN
jgi:hypothetical protein